MPDDPPPAATTAAERKLFRFSAAARLDACEAVAQSWQTELDDEIRKSAIAAIEALEPHVEAALAAAVPHLSPPPPDSERAEAAAAEMWRLVGSENVAEWTDLPLPDRQAWTAAFLRALKVLGGDQR